MAYVVFVINCPNQSIQDLNDKCQLPTKVQESLQGAQQLMIDIASGFVPGEVQITTRDSTVSVSTSGAQSEQETYSHL